MTIEDTEYQGAITIAEAARQLGVSTGVIYSWLKAFPPVIPVTRLGSRGFDRGEFEKWVKEGNIPALP